MSKTYFLNVNLHKDREKLGSYHFSNGLTILFSGSVLGRADNITAGQHLNPKRNPLLPFGDTPAGEYAAVVISPSTDVHTYGPYSRYYLIPKSGDALKSQRTELEGHGGSINPLYTQWGGLRPTNGCLRFYNDEIKAMTDLSALPGVETLVRVVELI